MSEPPALRRSRAEPREVIELRHLRQTQPELSSAIDMQVALIEMQHRVQSRVPLPWLQTDPQWLRSQYAAGRPVVRFGDIPIAWSDFRLTFRQTADILRRFDALEPADHDALATLNRDVHFEGVVREWYERTSGVNGPGPSGATAEEALGGLDQVLILALRPFLARCAEVLMPRKDLPPWNHGRCPYCGWEADFAVIMPSADRRLSCGRCVAQWPFDPIACPFCMNDDRLRITSFATRDGRYRVTGCDKCRRYLKAYDARNAARPVMVAVDTIATLPLDAAAIQRGYSG
jgi:ribosomal protein S27AE